MPDNFFLLQVIWGAFSSHDVRSMAVQTLNGFTDAGLCAYCFIFITRVYFCKAGTNFSVSLFTI